MKGFAVGLHEVGERWDLKGAQAAIFKAQHPDFVPFGNFVEERSVAVRAAAQPDKEWPVYGVSNKDGVFLSHMQRGDTFRVPYKQIRKDWFFHNPTRANVGSLGRVPDVPDDALTSPEYQVWSITDDDWLPEYVDALIKMPFFNLLIQVHRVGAVKERLYARNLMEIPVPVRDRGFQTELVAKWQELQVNIAATATRIAAHEEALVTEVMASAGIAINTSPMRPRAFALDLHEVDRWGVGFNRHTWTLGNLLTTQLFEQAPLSQVAELNPARTKKILAGTRVSFVPMEAVSETSGAIELVEEELIEDVSKGYTAFEEGDVLWAKITPCMENGKCAVARGLKNGAGFGSTEFHVVRSLDPTATLPEYLWTLLRLQTLRSAARRFFTGSAGQQRVPSDFLEDLSIPIPPQDVQLAIVTAVQEKRQSVARELKALDEFRRQAMGRIESDIVSGKLSAHIASFTPLNSAAISRFRSD